MKYRVYDTSDPIDMEESSYEDIEAVSPEVAALSYSRALSLGHLVEELPDSPGQASVWRVSARWPCAAEVALVLVSVPFEVEG